MLPESKSGTTLQNHTAMCHSHYQEAFIALIPPRENPYGSKSSKMKGVTKRTTMKIEFFTDFRTKFLNNGRPVVS
jgi:hypothetical protein